MAQSAQEIYLRGLAYRHQAIRSEAEYNDWKRSHPDEQATYKDLLEGRALLEGKGESAEKTPTPPAIAPSEPTAPINNTESNVMERENHGSGIIEVNSSEDTRRKGVSDMQAQDTPQTPLATANNKLPQASIENKPVLQDISTEVFQQTSLPVSGTESISKYIPIETPEPKTNSTPITENDPITQLSDDITKLDRDEEAKKAQFEESLRIDESRESTRQQAYEQEQRSYDAKVLEIDQEMEFDNNIRKKLDADDRRKMDQEREFDRRFQQAKANGMPQERLAAIEREEQARRREWREHVRDEHTKIDRRGKGREERRGYLHKPPSKFEEQQRKGAAQAALAKKKGT